MLQAPAHRGRGHTLKSLLRRHAHTQAGGAAEALPANVWRAASGHTPGGGCGQHGGCGRSGDSLPEVFAAIFVDRRPLPHHTPWPATTPLGPPTRPLSSHHTREPATTPTTQPLPRPTDHPPPLHTLPDVSTRPVPLETCQSQAIPASRDASFRPGAAPSFYHLLP